MRILCDVCEASAARYFCAADEAALCAKCDDKVHGCNKLASRHVRLELAESREVPSCDICGSNPAYFFCGIDGTSLCLQCDMGVHVGGKRTHERYLLMGQRLQLPDSSWNEKGAVNPESAKDQQKKHSLFHLYQHDQQVYPKYSSNLNIMEAPAVAITMKEIGLRDRQGIDLNARPQHLQSHPILSVKDNEQFSSSDDKCMGIVPELSSKDMNISDT